MSDFVEIFTVYSQMNLAYNRIKIFELTRWLISKFDLLIIFVFEGKESIFDIITELQFSDYLENLGQLPVQEVFEGTDDCVL